jgi:hypothetical protein
MTLPLRDDVSGAELSKAHEEYQDFLGKGFSLYTGKVSDLVRQLSLAGVVIIWLFKGDGIKTPLINPQMRAAAAFLLSALILDFFQYVIGAAVYAKWAVRLGRDGVAKTYAAECAEAKRSSRIAKLPYLGVMKHIELAGVLFWAKVGALVLGYIMLLWHLGRTALIV